MSNPHTSPIEDALFRSLELDDELPEPYGADIYCQEQSVMVEVSGDE